MGFSETLNAYMEKYDISGSELVRESGLSASQISRYRNGRLKPSASGTTVSSLASAISAISARRDAQTLSEEEVYSALTPDAEPMQDGFENIGRSLDTLITNLNINVSTLSRYLNFDASYISRIRSGHRHPARLPEFCSGVAEFVARRRGEYSAELLSRLFGCPPEQVMSEAGCYNAALKMLSSGIEQQNNPMQHFLKTLDGFQINDYLRAMSLGGGPSDPSFLFPDPLPESKDYCTLTGFMEAELAWLKATLLSRSEDVLMYSDMPMEEMSKDLALSKRWLAGMAMLLKSGCRINIIHSLDRSFYDMMLGLESWIPLYMTGLISPYYLNGYSDSYFHHFLRVSSGAAVSGEAIVGHHSEGRYHFTTDSAEREYIRLRGDRLLSKAHPLMNIYRQDRAARFHSFMYNTFSKASDKHRNILSSPPLYSLSPELLEQILAHNEHDDKLRAQISEHVSRSHDLFIQYLSSGTICDELTCLSREEFEAFPVTLSLSDIFCEADISYTYEEYLEHIRLTLAMSEELSGYNCAVTEQTSFRNIQIRMALGEYAIISKSKAPAIHFVVEHAKLRQAILNIITPIVNEAE